MPYRKDLPLQSSLFENDKGWQEHWNGMPEFTQENLLPYRQITVNFSSPEDFRKFQELMAQVITEKTRSIWFPKADLRHAAHLQYFDEP